MSIIKTKEPRVGDIVRWKGWEVVRKIDEHGATLSSGNGVCTGATFDTIERVAQRDVFGVEIDAYSDGTILVDGELHRRGTIVDRLE
jgi:hypothetical protein